MQIGDKVKSRLYMIKGTGTVISFSELFDEIYVEVLFNDGTKISTAKSDLIEEDNPLTRLQNSNIDKPFAFLVKNMALHLEVNISENKIITSTNYKIQPLPHQILTVHFIMNRFQPRSLIADEVGLGKTIEAILLYQEYKLRKMVKRILIVTPSGLITQWHEEIFSKFNEQFVIYNNEFIKTLKQSYGEETNVWKLHDKIIVSIDFIKPQKISPILDNEEKQKREWHNQYIFNDIASAEFDMVIIDEAHKLTKRGDGLESARFKLGEKLSSSIPIFILLTATPHQGDEDMFFNLLKLVDPVLFSDKKMITPELVQEVTARNKKRAVVDFNKNLIFKHRITSIIEIKRTKEINYNEIELYSHVTEYTTKYYNLAKRNNNSIWALLMILYQRILSSSSFAILETMKKRKVFLEYNKKETEDLEIIEDADEIDRADILFQKVSSNKEDIEIEKTFIDKCIQLTQKLTITFADLKFFKLVEIIEEIKTRENKIDIKFIIFTEFRATQNAIIEFLKKFGYVCSYIHGSLSREERIEQIELFRNENQIMVSTDAGGEGINLQFCYCMINFDMPWNPARLEQRIGRIDRIGQKHNVLIFNFHLTDTVEDRVRQVLETKLNIIKKQFGEDKYADVISLLQDEFSFDKIYLDAILIKNRENETLSKIAEDIYNRAQQLLEKDELLVPFSNFQEDANDYLNTEVNKIIKNFVINYLAYKNIEISLYKDNSNLCYFINPFHKQDIGPHTYRNVTFDNISSYKSEKIEFINLEHPFVATLRKIIHRSFTFGTVSAFRLEINKFLDVKGFWFVYKLLIKNHVDREKICFISVFMEDENFCNNRISSYLENNIIETTQVLPNFKCNERINIYADNALNEAKKKANDVFTATKLMWIEEVNKYEKKTEDYFRLKENSFKNIQVDNIRTSKLQSLSREKKEEERKFQLKKNIVPKLELYQIAFVEFL
ncbi:MAG: DEAD/DEAH box helicase family protein [Desulfobacterales bacterium]|nr:DEAD/DEAH box helicase family protein [Desulfobacterales bacterium]